MKTVELFSGTGSFSKIMQKHGHVTFTVDNERKFSPDLCCDIRSIRPMHHALENVDILWASPPCQGFSVAAIGRNWGGGKGAYVPKSESARLSIDLVQHAILLIEGSHPRYWFIENPRGLLRKMSFMEHFLSRAGGVRHTVTYCQYGDTRMKPTDIWTNAKWWNPRKICKNGSPCHEAAPRGSRTGTQGLKGAMDRGRIPAALFEEILNQMPIIYAKDTEEK